MATDIPMEFEQIEKTWRPQDVVRSEGITADRPAALAMVLDQPNPVVRDGDRLPPLWHWLFFLPAHQQRALGEDGHPREDDFLPPLPRRRRMFGGGRLEVSAPLRCGDHVVRRSTLRSKRVRVGTSGPLLLTTVEYTFLVDDQVRMVEEQEHVYRRAEDVSASPIPAPSDGGAPPAAEMALSFPTDPVRLFRFSAITANAHRIHYDREYTTQVEGYPGLVVHGPLVALLLLELPRRAQLYVRSFSWRARAPFFVGDTIEVAGRRRGDVVSLTAGTHGSWERLTGDAQIARAAAHGGDDDVR